MPKYDNSAFEEFKRIFEEASAEHNALNPEVTDNVSTDVLADMFNNIRDKLKVLSGDYENALCFRQREILDTFIQLLNYILDHCAVCKYYYIYKRLAALCSDLFGEESELSKLLKLLKQYVIKYNELVIPPETPCVVSKTKTSQKSNTYGEATEAYSSLKNKASEIKSTIEENSTDIDGWISGYNEYIENYYGYFYNMLENSKGEVIDDDGVLLYNKNTPNIENKQLDNLPNSISDMKEIMLSNIAKLQTNNIYYGTTEEMDILKTTFGYDMRAGLTSTNNMLTGCNYWELVDVGSYGDAGIIATDSSALYDMMPLFEGSNFYIPRSTTIINVSKTERDGEVKEILLNGYGNNKNIDTGESISYLNISKPNIDLYTHNQPFIVGYDKKLLPYKYQWSTTSGSTTYSKTQLTLYYDVENDEYYKKTSEPQNINELITDSEDSEASVLPIYVKDNIKLYAYNGYVYKYTNGTFNGILKITNSINCVPKIAAIPTNSLVSQYENITSDIETYKNKIKSVEESYPPKRLLIDKIKEIAKKLKKYITAYLGMDQDPSMKISKPDENGNVDVEIGGDDDGKKETFKARSISARSFKDNRFVGMVGKVDRKGFVAQKSYVFITIPVNRSGRRKTKKLRVSSPNLKILSVEFKHSPKCVVFKLFNRWDYTANITIENDGEKPNDKNKSPYITGRYYLRFGSVFPAKKDIDMGAESQQIKISEPNKSSSWSSGRIKNKGTFMASNLNIKGIFKNDEARYSTVDRNEYVNKFADKIDFSYNINSITNGKTYVFSGEGLELNDSLKEDMVKENAIYYRNCSFYKGSAKLKDPTKKENDDENTTDNTSSKDVIVMIKPKGETYTDRGYYSVSIYLDPDSTMNNQIYEQNEDDESVYLPMLASSLYVNKCYCKSVLSKTSTSDKLVGALLALAVMFDDENFAPIDNDLFNMFIGEIEELQTTMLDEIIRAINNVGASAQTAILTNGMYKSFDSSYSDTYVSDIITDYSQIKSKSDTFVSELTDIEALFKGSYNSDIENYITKLNKAYVEHINDIINSEDLIHKYKNRLNVIMPTAMQQISLSSTLSLFYNFVTGNSQSLNALALSGGKIIKTYLTRVYSDWLNIYNVKVYNKDDVTKTKFIIEQEYLQLFYILSVINDSLKNEYNPISDELSEYYRSLLLRFLSENIYNTHLSELFAHDVITKTLNYKEYSKYYDIENLSFNTYYINPYITEIFPQFEIINNIDIDHLPVMTVTNIEKLNIEDIQKFDMTNFFKPFIYKAILEDRPSTIKNKLTQLWDFLNNGQKLNVRELILKYNLIVVLYELETEIENTNYHIGITGKGNVEDDIKDIMKAIIAVTDYREMITDYTIDMLLNNDSDVAHPYNYILINLLKNKLTIIDDVVYDGGDVYE